MPIGSPRLAVWVFLAACQGCHPAERTAPKPVPARHADEFRRDAAAFARAHGDVRPYHVESYAVKGAFDWATATLTATNTVTLTLDAGAPPTVVLDALMTIDSVRLVGGGPLPFAVDRNEETLTVDLKALPATTLAQPLALKVGYRSVANDQGAGLTGFQADALRAIRPRAGDPAGSRALNTMSEPLGAHQWMPCNDDPADRAKFSLELTLDAGDSLIANGDLVSDAVEPGTQRHTTRYATRYTLPTYLMAFAAGEFVTASEDHDGLPLSVWARRGVPVDFQGVLGQLGREVDLYQSHLIPYPFEKYAVVFLPEFESGEEHAGVTFQREIEGTDPHLEGDVSLLGHELAHQWFGDYVTVRTWDDLWIKEGMATLLEIEQLRPFIDQNHASGLNAALNTLTGTDAIRDPGLQPADKYNTGPYGRAAWLITQLRGLAGEETFWAVLRGVLKDHAFGTISSDEFLNAFRPVVGDDVWAKANWALSAKKMPVLAAAPVAGAPGQVAVTLADPDGSLVTPLTLRLYKNAGAYQDQLLAAGGTVTLTPDPASPLLVIDPQDQQAMLAITPGLGAFATTLSPWLAPKSADGRAVFAAAPASAQLVALSADTSWFSDAQGFQSVYATLASDEARLQALRLACAAGSAPGLPAPQLAAWQAATSDALVAAPSFGIYSWYVAPALGKCGGLAGPATFQAELARLARAPDDPSMDEPRLLVLGHLGLDPTAAFAAFGAVGTHGPSVRIRADAVATLVSYLGQGGFDRPTAEALPEWQQYFRDVLASTRVGEVARQAINGVVAGADLDALPVLHDVTLGGTNSNTELAALCAAYQLTRTAPAKWTGFVKSLGDPASLPAVIAARLTTPEACGAAKLF